jgi:hypothetical protein
MRLALAAAVLALAACQPRQPGADTSDVEAGQDELPAAPEPAPNPAPVTFEPLSKTAEAFTGAIALSSRPRAGPNAPPAMKLEAASGLVYETELNPGGAEQASAIDWKAVFGPDIVSAADPPPGSPSIDLHIVTLEAAPAVAPNGGLCGADRTFAIAMATGLSVGAQGMMSIAAFRGDRWPPESETALCGTFSYAPPQRTSPPR